ncbi:MAG: HAD-IIA family hydrolase [Gemmatimonas sp.]
MPTNLSFAELRTRHQAILFDAYGVLVDAAGARPGAAAAIDLLRQHDQPFLVVTNDASRSPRSAAARFSRLGINIAPENVLSSGMMIAPALREQNTAGVRAVVLGPEDSANYAREAGVTVVEASVDDPAEVVIFADEGGFNTLSIMDDVLSMVVAAVRQGKRPRMLLANPDLIYPAGNNSFGFTAGGLALMLEHALQLILGENAPKFEHLGKPSPRIFTEALARVGVTDAVMIGDQLHTDVAGANSVGMASVLLLGGVGDARAHEEWGDWTPSYVMKSL